MTPASPAYASWSWKLICGIFVVPVVLVLVLMIGLAVRYLSAKARLDRLKSNPSSPIQSHAQKRIPVRVDLEFERVVPTSIRNMVGDARSLPLEPIKAIHLNGASDDELARLAGDIDAAFVSICASRPTDGTDGFRVTDRGLESLTHLPSCRELGLYRGQFSSRGLATLANAPKLVNLGIYHAQLSEDWSVAIRRFPRLMRLDVAVDRSMSAKDIAGVAANPRLFRVRLNPHYSSALGAFGDVPDVTMWHLGVKHLTRDMLEALSAVKDLHSLVVEFQAMSPDAFQGFTVLPSLQSVQICGFGIGGDCWRGLHACSKLQSLSIADYGQTTEHGLAQLADLKSLTQLCLHYEVFGPRDLEAVSQLARLRALRLVMLSRSKLAGLASLKELVHLEELDLQAVEEFDRNLPIIQSMPRLHWLRYESMLTAPHPLQSLLDQSTFPAPLVPDARRIVMQMKDSSQVDQEPEPLSIGERVLLPKDRFSQGSF